MHDNKGREIKKGDILRISIYSSKAQGNVERFGIATELRPSSTSCNLDVGYVDDAPTLLNACCTAAETEIIAAVDGRDLTPPAPEMPQT